jgi:hypothetical protein
MWNDEDNNPYGAFDRRDSSSSFAGNQNSPPARSSSYSYSGNQHSSGHHDRPITPTSTSSNENNEPPEFISRPRDLSEGDDDDADTQQGSQSVSRKKDGYDSRVEQILYEHADLPIVITDAGKNHESGGNYIVYTIRTGVSLPTPRWTLTDQSRMSRSAGGIQISAHYGMLS